MHCLLGAVALPQLRSVPPGSAGRGNVGVGVGWEVTDFSKEQYRKQNAKSVK